MIDTERCSLQASVPINPGMHPDRPGAGRAPPPPPRSRPRPPARHANRSDGVDVRQELLPLIPGCRPSGAYPFSLSQNVLVPFLGIRLGPKHKARKDTYDEAITISTTILRGAINHFMLVDSKNKQQRLISNLFQKRTVVVGGGSGSSGGGGGSGAAAAASAAATPMAVDAGV